MPAARLVEAAESALLEYEQRDARPPDNIDTCAAYLRLLLAIEDWGQPAASLALIAQRLMIFIQDNIPPRLTLRATDELRKLTLQARARLGKPNPSIAFVRAAAPVWSHVSIPVPGASGRLESMVSIDYAVWFAETPITNEQLLALSDAIPDFSAISTVRPEVWSWEDVRSRPKVEAEYSAESGCWH